MAVKNRPMRMTRAYVEGYVEGRTNPATHVEAPYARTQEVNDFARGLHRGRVLRAFFSQTKTGNVEIDKDVLALRRERGEKI